MSAEQAQTIYELLDQNGVQFWVIGGWGVDAHPDGREIDVHVIDIDHEGAVVQFHTDPWPLPLDTVSGVGTIDGVTVRCVSRAAQLTMHSSYDLPDKHREDIRLLQGTP
jgi:lincosamide nucleotidyltransferase A/C/D/E